MLSAVKVQRCDSLTAHGLFIELLKIEGVEQQSA